MKGSEQYMLMQAPFVVENLDFLDAYGMETSDPVCPSLPDR